YARFTGPHALALSSGQELTARHFVIATGSIVSQPPLPQLKGVGYLTSDDALALARLPKSLIILGVGAVAVEFAQLFARFDVEVTLIQRSKQILKETDPDAAGVAATVLQRDGVRLFTHTHLVDAYREGACKVVVFTHEDRKQEVRAEEILFGLGRSP